jgi:Uma2 family endonuclease
MSAATPTTRRLLTAEEALEQAGAGRWELVRGELRDMPPAGGEHGIRAMRLGTRLTVYVEAHDLGAVLAAETGFLIARDPDTVRGPDAAFISKEKVPAQWPSGWLTIVPDLIVEVVSPRDRVGEVEDKIAEWLGFGVRLVWVVYPGSRTFQIHRPDQRPRVLSEADTLDGGEIVPGFTLPLSDLFA